MTADIELSILLPAFIAGILVLATHVPLGIMVLKRGIIFIDLAIAQIAGLGVILAHMLFHDPGNWQVQLTATACAMGGALLLRWTEKKWLAIQEALIGVVFVLSASVSLLLLSDNPHGSEQLKDILSGQILWVGYQQLGYVAVFYALLLSLAYAFRRRHSGVGFYLLFALSVTASVQLVGVYLVFSSLILPALAVWKIPHYQGKLRIGFLTGIVGYALGLVISLLSDLPSGPVIVITLMLSALVIYNLVRDNN